MTEETNVPATTDAAASGTPEIGRNEPCPCGSGKKYKRCHGVAAAPKLTTPKPGLPDIAGGAGAPGMGGGMPGGFDPSKMDPQMMLQFSQMLQRLPKGQLQRLQGIMQRAMSGRDVTRESEEFERTLPPELQQLMVSFAQQMQAMGGVPGMGMGAALPAAGDSGEMSAEQAREIVAAAAAEGKISKDEADKLLVASSDEKKKSGLFKNLFKRGNP